MLSRKNTASQQVVNSRLRLLLYVQLYGNRQSYLLSFLSIAHERMTFSHIEFSLKLRTGEKRQLNLKGNINMLSVFFAHRSNKHNQDQTKCPISFEVISPSYEKYLLMHHKDTIKRCYLYLKLLEEIPREKKSNSSKTPA